MYYIPFEYSRSADKDYDFMIKPKIVPNGFTKLIQKVLYLRDSLRQHELDWDSLLFFVTLDGMHIAFQAKNNGLDYVGRPIYSIRGFFSQNTYRSILGIPDLIMFFHKNGNDVLPKKDLFIDDKINPLLPIKESQIEEMSCPTFKNLIYDVGKGDCNYCFVFGPQSSTVFAQAKSIMINGMNLFKRHYDTEIAYIEEGYKYPVFETISNKTGSTPVTNENQAFLYLKLYKNAYAWVLRRTSDDYVLKSAKRRFQDKISMKQLINQANSIKRFYSLIGISLR